MDALSAFFEAVPPDVQPHLEIRTPGLLTPEYFGFLEDAGFGHVFSHWQYLPPIREQWHKAGQRFTAADGRAVARLLSPLKMSFEDAYAAAYPFEQPVAAWVGSEETQRMVLDAAAPLTVYGDGDPIATLPCEITVQRKAVRVLG